MERTLTFGRSKFLVRERKRRLIIVVGFSLSSGRTRSDALDLIHRPRFRPGYAHGTHAECTFDLHPVPVSISIALGSQGRCRLDGFGPLTHELFLMHETIR